MDQIVRDMKTQSLTDGGRLVSGFTANNLFVIIRFDANGQVVEVKRESDTVREATEFAVKLLIVSAGVIVGSGIISSIVDRG